MRRVGVSSVIFGLILLSTVVWAEIPLMINYQGRLTELSGDPVDDGQYGFIFRIYDDPVAGNMLWQTDSTLWIDVGGGLFSYLLGANFPLPESLAVYDSLWLGIKVGPETIEPRIPLVSVNFAFKSLLAESSLRSDTADFAWSIADESVLSSKIAANAITGDKIMDGTIQFADIGANGAAEGQIMKRRGGAWVAADDSVSASGTGGWIDDGNAVRLATATDSVGIGTAAPTEKLEISGNIKATGKATLGPNNLNSGTNTFVAGANNTVSGIVSAVGGGSDNQAIQDYAVIGGGGDNEASGSTATIAGGGFNIASARGSAIGGGGYNKAHGEYSVVAGGGGAVHIDSNQALGDFSAIGGGKGNIALGYTSTIGGGCRGQTDNNYTTVGGGIECSAGGLYAAVLGGETNNASADYSAIGGGGDNEASGNAATIAGGGFNIASARGSAIGGGGINRARGEYSVVAGGGGALQADSNQAFEDYSAIGGGRGNIALGYASTIGGGYRGQTDNIYTTVGGGFECRAGGSYAAVLGGQTNNASADYSAIGGGGDNEASGNAATIAGGGFNIASARGSAIGGGGINRARGEYSVVAGGGGALQVDSNSAGGTGSVVSGGRSNHAAAHYSVIPGGYSNAIDINAGFSCLVGINSDLTEDSTFMVDMPHIRFGDETDGYEFPAFDGDNGQVMATDGSGQLSWTDASSGTGIVPVGAVVAWVKTYPNTPALPGNFVECNGQTLSDPESAYNGQALPNLNGENRFLRGSTTSGAAGGADNHQHILWSANWGQQPVGISPGYIATDGDVSHTGDFNTQDASTLPSYYEVVWIMRVK